MSNVKKRFQHPTGIEYFDNAVEIDLEIWSFVKKEFKNKSRKDIKADCEEMNSAPEGCIPYRYWDTHAKPLHSMAWELVRIVRNMYDIGKPKSQVEIKNKRKLAKEAITVCNNIHDALRITEEELPMIDPDKMDKAFELLDLELKLLKGFSKYRILNSSVPGEQ